MEQLPQEKNKEAWWRPAIEIFGRVSAWVIVPILLALIVGKYLDTRYDTKPWIFLGLTGAAFLISLFGIVRVTKTYLEKIQNDNPNKPK